MPHFFGAASRAPSSRGVASACSMRDAACRLVFSESDGLPGLIVDRYGEYLVCQFLSAGAEAWRATIVELLDELCAPRGIYERSEGGARHKEGLPSRRGVLAGEEPPRELEIVVGGRSARRRYRERPKDRRLSRPAAQSRARRRARARSATCSMLSRIRADSRSRACAPARQRATLIDSSADALALAEREAAANGVLDRCRFVVANVFDELRAVRDAGTRFDLVVLDPPKFVHSADQLAAGSRGYKDINMLGLGAGQAGRRARDVLVLGPRRRGAVSEDRRGRRRRRRPHCANSRAALAARRITLLRPSFRKATT